MKSFCKLSDAEKSMIKQVISVRVALFNDDQILLVSSDNGKKWHLPGGWLDGDESFKDCAVREVYEETGLKIKNTINFFALGRYISEYSKIYKNIISKTELFCRSTIDGNKMDLMSSLNAWKDKDAGLINAKQFFSKESLIDMIKEKRFLHSMDNIVDAEEIIDTLFNKKSNFIMTSR